ncbi:MAG: TIGR03915 family putative DNA repair protein [Prevotella sp.]|nr:TIGR03915 family putative DNA repair protein [Prevotella sp.]
MTVYTFDNTLDGLLTAVFDSFALHQQDVTLLAEGEQLPLFADEPHLVVTDGEKAARVWKGLEKHLSVSGLRVITVSWLSEERTLHQPLFNYICKVFRQPTGAPSIESNASDEDVLAVRNTCRRVLHEQLRMKQFIRFQKAKDGTYLGVVSPDHNVLPLVIDHFQDRFGDQPWLIYDAKRHYGYYYTPTPPHTGAGSSPIRITFEDEAAIPFNLENGKLDANLLSSDDQLLQDLWRTYFKAICIKERMNPRKQLSDMPRRYWRYMTEKNK